MSVKKMREERKWFQALAEQVRGGGVPMNNRLGSLRQLAISKMLRIAADRHPFHPILAKAAIELYSYDDRLAATLLVHVADDWKALIRETRKRLNKPK